jgi:CxxC motif-containing protein (DUF1111 family)
MTKRALLPIISVVVVLVAPQAVGRFVPRDPGVRRGPSGAGGMLGGLTPTQQAFFSAGLAVFEASESIADGLGPRFNLDSCVGCHAQPVTGGSSPALNPQVAMATAFGARNLVPSFIRLDGPVREVRYKYRSDGRRDGGVHALFVISGRVDTTGNARDCPIQQEDFATQVANHNVSLRIPTPTFGGGLIEAIPDNAILANRHQDAAEKAAAGIAGRPHRIRPTGTPNRTGHDGAIARFGWKAQNKSLLLLAGEAYSVEQGISNELFPSERDETPACQYKAAPNDATATAGASGSDGLSDIQKFALFMRFLTAPQPSADTPGGAASIARGNHIFTIVGCALCHTPVLHTGPATVPALSGQPVSLFSDLLLHRMGPNLADEIIQGDAGGDEFRTAPLWGLGQRIFFLHDGRTTDLVDAIRAHRSAGNAQYPSSEANRVVDRFSGLNDPQKQDVLNFLRSL